MGGGEGCQMSGKLADQWQLELSTATPFCIIGREAR